MTLDNVVHTGGCHCGCVQFEVEAPRVIRVENCNCSMCSKVGFLHLIVGSEQFRIVAGEDSLVEYRFNSGTARHLFCSVCGVKAFYVPRSHPTGWSVNARCLNPGTVEEMVVVDFDGANWEANIEALRSVTPLTD